MIRRRLVSVLAFTVLTALAVTPVDAAVVPPGAEELSAHVGALTAPEMEGRGSGTPGNELAARYIADRLAGFGLRPGGDNGSFLQPFVVSTVSALGPGSELGRTGPSPVRLDPGRDWMPHGGSLTVGVTGEVVFVGYGVTAADQGYDDYAGVDVKDKIALALEGAPPHLSAARSSRLEKLMAARRRGASALVLVTRDALPALAATAVPVRIVSGSITVAGADQLLAPAGRTIAQLQDDIAGGRQPRSFATGIQAQMKVDLVREERRTANVIGVLPGTDPVRARDVVVLGAHFDHLGRVGGVVHPGADDNASGTSVVLGLARAFASAGGAPETLVFALFSGEEMGLLGSAHYARHPALPLDRTIAMLNFDMVGRMRARKLNVGGVESGTGLRAIVSEATGGGLDLALHDTPFAPSDHVSFYSAGTPVLFFFTGEHDDYHMPGDTADKINAPGMAEVARVAVGIVERLAGGQRPAYVKVTRPARERQFAGAPGGAFLGISPDLGGQAEGLRLGSVIPGTAASRAGLQPGDVLVRFADHPVNSFPDLRNLIAARRPGDSVGRHLPSRRRSARNLSDPGRAPLTALSRGGGLRPPAETSPPKQLAPRKSRRSKRSLRWVRLYRKSRKKARMSAARAAGSSSAAKCPPAGIMVQRLML